MNCYSPYSKESITLLKTETSEKRKLQLKTFSPTDMEWTAMTKIQIQQDMNKK